MRLVRHPSSSLRPIVLVLTPIVLSGFVWGCSAAAPPAFDGTKAFSQVRAQCHFGPRPVGSEAHDKTRQYLAQELKRYTQAVRTQDFQQVFDGRTYVLSNILAEFGPTSGKRILLCAHWDTRPTADLELAPADRKKPILGANDGASGVAVLLELARMFREHPPASPVTVVLFDGEDFGPGSDRMYLGSRHFARSITDPSAYSYGILLDMVGDRDLAIYREKGSNRHARAVVDRVWKHARNLGYGKYFMDESKYEVLDDHIPLIRKGIPCIDVIDFDYAYWHTLADTVDKCSPESLKIVGETIASVVYSKSGR